jgi:hypothetical protein
MLIASKYEEIWAPEVILYCLLNWMNESSMKHWKHIYWMRLCFVCVYRLMTLYAYQTMHMSENRFWLWRKQSWENWNGIWQFLLLMSFWFGTSKPRLPLIKRYIFLSSLVVRIVKIVQVPFDYWLWNGFI